MSAEQQERLFYDSELEGLRDDVNALGGPKEIGRWFWPEKSIEAARNMVNDRLNAERRDRFTEDQRRLIMRKAREKRGFSATLNFICDDTGFERPRAKNPEDEAAALQRRYIESVNLQRQIADRLERLARSPLQAIQTKGAA